MSTDSAIILTAVFSVTIVVLGLFTFFVLMMVRNHRKVEAAQRERIRQMQLFSEKLQTAREEEQKRIARELHDELGGTLTSIKYDLLWLEQRTSVQGEVAQRFHVMRDLIDSTTKVVQRISAELRPKIGNSFYRRSCNNGSLSNSPGVVNEYCAPRTSYICRSESTASW